MQSLRRLCSLARKLTMGSELDASVYPLARKDPAVVADFHGDKIADPYRWLEDPDAEETKAYVDRLNDVSKPFLEAAPDRAAMTKRLTEMWDYQKYGCIAKHAGKYTYSYNSGLQNQAVYYIADAPSGPGTVFLDPNALSADGTTAISFKSYTEDGTLMAYGLAEKGSDWNTLKVIKFPSGEELPDVLTKLRYTSVSWLHDNSGFFYSMYPASAAEGKGTATEANKNHSLYFHALGTAQAADVLVHATPENPDFLIGAEVSQDGAVVLVTLDKGCDPTNLLYFANIQPGTMPKGKLDLKPIVDKFEAKFDYVTSDGMSAVIMTNHESPLFKLIRIDLNKPDKASWTTLVAEKKDKLNWATRFAGDKLMLSYLEDCKDTLYVVDLKTGKELYQIPIDIGSVSGLYGEMKETEVFFKFESDLNPGAIYRLDFSSPDTDTTAPKAELIRQIKINGFDPSAFKAEQVFYPSKDGTKIPMFILSKADMPRDSSNPTILYGYGGFNIPLTPSFSVSRLMFVAHLGGVYAIANLRGGSEYGERWHEAGMMDRKQNVFDDFIAAAEFLIAEKICVSSNLVSHGASNGGLLVGATANQRPDLFKGVINRVGVLDMLRYHHFTIGHAWIPEFGCADEAEAYAYIRKYSPLHNVAAPGAGGVTQLPAMLIMTADHDDRVVPLHSLKFIATVYAAVAASPAQRNPLLARVEVKAGHGAGKPTSKIIEELVDIYSFVQRILEAKWKP